MTKVYGGELSIIGDDALRRLLADWPSPIEHVVTTQDQDYDFLKAGCDACRFKRRPNLYEPALRAQTENIMTRIILLDSIAEN